MNPPEMICHNKTVQLKHYRSNAKAHVIALYNAQDANEIIRLPVYYLQGVRSNVLQPGTERERRYWKIYENSLPDMIHNLVEEVKIFGVFEVGLIPPSSRNDAAPFFSALFNADLIKEDISNIVTRRNDFRCGLANSDEDVLDAISVEQGSYSQRLDSIERLLIVDDIFASGRTAAAIIYRLHEAGLSKNADIHIAAPLAIGDWFIH